MVTQKTKKNPRVRVSISLDEREYKKYLVAAESLGWPVTTLVEVASRYGLTALLKREAENERLARHIRSLKTDPNYPLADASAAFVASDESEDFFPALDIDRGE